MAGEIKKPPACLQNPTSYKHDAPKHGSRGQKPSRPRFDAFIYEVGYAKLQIIR
nr:MAG TPA_asm: hypothetical protein [Caudoviricetes sp.]